MWREENHSKAYSRVCVVRHVLFFWMIFDVMVSIFFSVSPGNCFMENQQKTQLAEECDVLSVMSWLLCGWEFFLLPHCGGNQWHGNLFYIPPRGLGFWKAGADSNKSCSGMAYGIKQSICAANFSAVMSPVCSLWQMQKMLWFLFYFILFSSRIWLPEQHSHSCIIWLD